MRDTKTLVRIKHGSHLYGTNTPASDEDYKSVHLPSGIDILMQRAEKVINNGVKLSDGPKNEVGDIDDQSFTLMKFLNMVTSGDTVGTEILFAPDSMIVETSKEWEYIRSIPNLLTNRQCRGFVAYCQRQAAKYGIKGSRMAAVKDLLDVLEMGRYSYGGDCKLVAIVGWLNQFCETHEFSAMVPIEQERGTIIHLECVDRKMPLTNSIKQAIEVYGKVYENYGQRARDAMNNENIDWKAISHAIRVARQAIELLTTGTITFPRPDAEELLAIKQGKIPYSVVEVILENLVEQVDFASQLSYLPDESDPAIVDSLVSEHYESQVVASW